LSALIAILSARRLVQAHVKAWAERTGWQGLGILRDSTRIPSIIWVIIPSPWLALLVSETPQEWKDYAIRGSSSLKCPQLFSFELMVKSLRIPYPYS